MSFVRWHYRDGRYVRSHFRRAARGNAPGALPLFALTDLGRTAEDVPRSIPRATLRRGSSGAPQEAWLFGMVHDADRVEAVVLDDRWDLEGRLDPVCTPIDVEAEHDIAHWGGSFRQGARAPARR